MYKKLKKQNYRRYEKDFLALRAGKLTEFTEEIIASGEVDKVDFSVGSLAPVWRYVRTRIVWSELTEPYDESVPLWFYLEEERLHTETHGYTLESLDLIDKFMYYFGEVFIQNNEGLRWEADNSDSRMAWYHKPVIKGIPHKESIYPLYQVLTGCVDIWHGEEQPEDNAFVEFYNNTLKSYEQWLEDTGRMKQSSYKSLK